MLQAAAGEWFEQDGDVPFMMEVYQIREDKRVQIPAVTHVDYSARIQTVDEHRNPRYFRLLQAFEAATGCPMLTNTSFNVRGEPIVCTPEDACRCFMATDMDALVLEDCVLLKEDQDKTTLADARTRHLKQFQLD